MTPDERLLTPNEVAERLALSPVTVAHMLRAGTLPGMKVGTLWRVPVADLDAYIRAGSEAAAAKRAARAAKRQPSAPAAAGLPPKPAKPARKPKPAAPAAAPALGSPEWAAGRRAARAPGADPDDEGGES